MAKIAKDEIVRFLKMKGVSVPPDFDQEDLMRVYGEVREGGVVSGVMSRAEKSAAMRRAAARIGERAPKIRPMEKGAAIKPTVPVPSKAKTETGVVVMEKSGKSFGERALDTETPVEPGIGGLLDALVYLFGGRKKTKKEKEQ
jgi:hypothetical protein